MSNDFKDKFMEVGGLWPTKSGKGFSGKLKNDALPSTAEIQIFMFANNSENPKAPKYKLFIERPKESPIPDGDEEMPF